MQGRGDGGQCQGVTAPAVETPKQGKGMDPVQGPSGEFSEEHLEKRDRDETGSEATAEVCRFLS